MLHITPYYIKKEKDERDSEQFPTDKIKSLLQTTNYSATPIKRVSILFFFSEITIVFGLACSNLDYSILLLVACTHTSVSFSQGRILKERVQS